MANSLKEVMEEAGVVLDPPRSLTLDEYNRMMQIVCPHGPNEPCTCKGCWACKGREVGCTCDIDWDLIPLVQEMYYP